MENESLGDSPRHWSDKPLSYSKISTWCSCPRKFKYQYIDKVPTQERDRTPLLKGSAIHSTLENYPEPGTHKLSEQYQDITDRFLNSDYKELFNYPNIRELKVAFDHNLNPQPYNNSALFRGYIDYMCFIDGEVHLIDWKTGSYKEQKYQDFNQLLFYAIFVFLKYSGVNTINIRYVYVEHLIENTLKLERMYLNNYIGEFRNLTEKMRLSEFEKIPQKLCEYCDFEKHCISDI